MDKVSFQEAATQAGIHLNTVKNWRKAGKLKTAQKVLENGHELWLVDPAEVVQIARQARQTLPDIAQQTSVDLGENKVDNDPTWPPSGAGAAANQGSPAGPTSAQAPALVEQNLAFFRESIVRPLVEDLARARTELGQAKEEIGTLKERLRALEAAQAAREVQPAPVAVQAGEITPRAPDLPQPPTEPVKRTFWRRLLGG